MPNVNGSGKKSEAGCDTLACESVIIVIFDLEKNDFSETKKSLKPDVTID